MSRCNKTNYFKNSLSLELLTCMASPAFFPSKGFRFFVFARCLPFRYFLHFINFFCSFNNAFIFALLYKAKFYCSIKSHTVLRIENG